MIYLDELTDSCDHIKKNYEEIIDPIKKDFHRFSPYKRKENSIFESYLNHI